MGASASIPTDPSRTVQVIGAGYSKTGTVSMQMALEILLKGPVLHGGTQIISRDDVYCRTWLRAYRTRHAGDTASTLKHVRAATRGFVGTTDLPTIDFIPELLELYPDAKVVLVKRDVDSWWRSTKHTEGQVGIWWLRLILWPIPGWRWLPYLIDEFGESIKEFVRSERPDGTRESREEAQHGPHILANYYNWVRSITPQKQLLEMEINEGWEPLCKFLDLPIPDEPFPRANDAAAMEKTVKTVFGKVLQVWAGILCGAGGTVYLGLWVWRRV